MSEAEQRYLSSLQANTSLDEQIELHTHTFIVKVWLETTEGEAGQAVWRGRITHVASGHQQYVNKMDSITKLISFYLWQMGIRPPLLKRLAHQLGISKLP